LNLPGKCIGIPPCPKGIAEFEAVTCTRTCDTGKGRKSIERELAITIGFDHCQFGFAGSEDTGKSSEGSLPAYGLETLIGAKMLESANDGVDTVALDDRGKGAKGMGFHGETSFGRVDKIYSKGQMVSAL
jgi:hypothetical protein